MYRHFPSKNDLVLAVLQRREQLWTVDLVERQSRLRGSTPEEQLLAIFAVFHDWFQKHEGFDGCSFINVLIELGAAHPAGQASIQYLGNIRSILRQRAETAGLRDADSFARSCHILMKGSIVAAAEGDREAAHRAQHMARTLIEPYRRPADSCTRTVMIARPKSPWALRSVATSGQCDAAHDGALRLSPASGRCPQPAGYQADRPTGDDAGDDRLHVYRALSVVRWLGGS